MARLKLSMKNKATGPGRFAVIELTKVLVNSSRAKFEAICHTAKARLKVGHATGQ